MTKKIVPLKAIQDSAYRSGRSPDWLKMKNPDAPAVTREAEEDWAR
jgi:ATP-dependent DNA ligase